MGFYYDHEKSINLTFFDELFQIFEQLFQNLNEPFMSFGRVLPNFVKELKAVFIKQKWGI